jgi:hypothetical protein
MIGRFNVLRNLSGRNSKRLTQMISETLGHGKRNQKKFVRETKVFVKSV